MVAVRGNKPHGSEKNGKIEELHALDAGNAWIIDSDTVKILQKVGLVEKMKGSKKKCKCSVKSCGIHIWRD